jgi:uncharacterized protein (TIGR02598 family)
MRLTTLSPYQGFTLVESTIAAAISVMYLSSLFTMNIASMETIRAAKESTAASQVLQQRMESMRIANWHQVTDADWLHDNLLNVDAPGGSYLKGVSETLILVPYGSASIGNMQLVRTAGSTTIVARDIGLLAENAVKVMWTVNYTGSPNDRAYSRQIVAILAKGGVAK